MLLMRPNGRLLVSSTGGAAGPMCAVRREQEVDEKARHVPGHEPHLRIPRQAVEKIGAAEDADEARDPGQRRPELALGAWIATAHGKHGSTDRDESGQRAGVRKRDEVVQ